MPPNLRIKKKMISEKEIIQRDQVFYLKNKRFMVRWEALFQKLMMDHFLPKEEVVLLIKVVNKFFQSEPNLVYLNDPVTIVGDIHG